MMPEAIAIVHAAKFKEVGTYHLTPNYGLQYIQHCPRTGFHPHHTETPLFEKAHHTITDRRLHIKVVDLRCDEFADH